MGMLASVRGLACLSVLVVASLGCAPVVHTSSVPVGGPRIATMDKVQIGATGIPAGATELGIVEAHSSQNVSLESLIPEFAAAAGRMGGNYAKIDRISTKFEIQALIMPCGQPGKTCAHSVEVPTVQIQGRAFLLSGGQP